MTRDGRGREVFSIDPAILGGGARFRALSPAEAEERQGGREAGGPEPDPGGAVARGGKREARPR